MSTVLHAMPSPHQAQNKSLVSKRPAPTVDLAYFNRNAYLPHQALVGQRIECNQHSFDSICGKDDWIKEQGEIVVQSLLFGVEIGAIEESVVTQLCEQDDIHNRKNTDIVKTSINNTLIHISDYLADEADAYFGKEQLKGIENTNFEIDLHWQDNDFSETQFGSNEVQGFRLSVFDNTCVSNVSSQHESIAILAKLLVSQLETFSLSATLEDLSSYAYMGEISDILDGEELPRIKQFNQDLLALIEDEDDDEKTALYFSEIATKYFPDEADCWTQQLEYDELDRIQSQIEDYIEHEETRELFNLIRSRIGQSSFDINTEIQLLRNMIIEQEALLPYFDQLAKIVLSAFTLTGATYSEIMSSGSDENIESQRIIISEADTEYGDILDAIYNRNMEVGEIGSLVIDIKEHSPSTILTGLKNTHLANLSLVFADYITTEANRIEPKQLEC